FALRAIFQVTKALSQYRQASMLSNSGRFWAPLSAAVCAGFLLQSPLDAIFSASLAAVALIVAIADLDRFEIPDVASCLMFVLGLGWVLSSSDADYWAILDAALRSGVAAGVLYSVRAAYHRIRGFEGLGLGDVKLAAAGAPWLSWAFLPLALLIAVSA